jgi:hypothetical protein
MTNSPPEVAGEAPLPDGSESSERIRLAGWLEFGCAHPEKLDMNAVRDAAIELRRLSAPAVEPVAVMEVPQRFCNKCGYFGPNELHQRPNGTGECGYLSCPVPASPAEQAATQAETPKAIGFSGMWLAPIDGTAVLLHMPTTTDKFAIGQWHGDAWGDDEGNYYVHEPKGWMSLDVLSRIANAAPTAPTGAQAEPMVKFENVDGKCNCALYPAGTFPNCQAHPAEQAAPKAEPTSIQDVMFEVFHYAHISDGFDSLEGNDRVGRRGAMLRQDKKIRAMLASLIATPSTDSGRATGEAADEALNAVDSLYDLMCSPSSYGARVDAKIALKKAILALAAQPVAGHQGGDNNG